MEHVLTPTPRYLNVLAVNPHVNLTVPVTQPFYSPIGLNLATKTPVEYLDSDEDGDSEDEAEKDATERTSEEFTNKTDQLLDYIDRTYLDGMAGEDAAETQKMMAKMRAAAGGGDQGEKKVMGYGFDAMFAPEDQ